MHQLGAEATAAYEGARDKVAAFINAPSRDEVIFTKNASEALNLVANTARWRTRSLQVGPGDEIVITEMEHHSNIVPWQLLAERTGATLRWFGITDDGRLDLSNIDELINERTKVVSLVWVSNMLGTVNPVAEIAAPGARGRRAGRGRRAPRRCRRCRSTCAALGADFFAFTGHKMRRPDRDRRAVGPARPARRAAAVPRRRRDDRDGDDDRARRTPPPPHRFEAGTPPIAQAVGLGAAVDYLSALGMDAIAAHEQRDHRVRAGAAAGRAGADDPRPGTTPVDRGGAVSFELDGVHPHDVGQVLDSLGIAVRAGHHCAQPAARAVRRPVDRPGRRSTCTRRRTRSTRWSTASD